MDKNTARLELFRRAINSQAEAETAGIAKKAEAAESPEADFKSRSMYDTLSEIKAEKARTQTAFKKEISRCDYDLKREVLSYRSSLTDEFFEEIKRELIEWKSTPDYEKYLKNAVKNAEDTLGGNAVILAAGEDLTAVKKLTSLEVRADISIKIGGINAADYGRGLFADFTLDSRLAEEKTKFSNNPLLRL